MEQLPENPAVLVLLVVSDGARWLPEVLRGLRAQKNRPIEIVAVDNASTDESHELLAKALGARRVVTLERRVGYGRALAAGLKVAAERQVVADAFLLLHDDCQLGPDAIDAMLRALRVDRVGIVGAKLVEWEDIALLQDIGQTTDRYGRSAPRVERGEIDQGQHDGLHDVLFASSAALLIAREVVEKVGLFDLRYVMLRDDLDLCWRARIAGFRTVVTTDATARHALAGMREERGAPLERRVRYFADRNVIATLIKNYSGLHLLVALPMTVMVTLTNAVIFLATGRRASAMQVLEALQWNIVHLPATLRARYKAQRSRSTSDSDVTALMHHSATRWRTQLEGALERVVGEVEEGSDEDLDAPHPGVVERLRAHPGGVMVFAGILALLVGGRTIFFSGHLAGIDLAPFPGSGRELWRAFASGWRGAAHGGGAPATPGLALLGLFQFLCFGSAWLAERALVIGSLVLAGITMWRLARALDLPPAARRVAVAAYALSPLALGTFGAGRLPDLLLLATAPALLSPLLRAAGILPSRGWRDLARGGALLAIVASLVPWALGFTLGAGVLLAALSLGGPAGRARAVAKRAFGLAGVALVLMLPWSVELFRPHSALGWGGPDPAARMTDVLGLAVSAVRPLPFFLRYGIPLAAAAGVAVALEHRRRLAALFGAVAVVALFASWGVARGVPWIAPRAALPLVAAAVCAAILAGLAWEAVSTTLHERHFGGAQLLSALIALLTAVQLAAGAGWLALGRFPGLVETGKLAPAFLVEEARQKGAFNIAWIDGTARAPRVALTDAAGATIASYLERPADPGARALHDSIAAIAGGGTTAGGKLLGTLGVRYVILRPEADAALEDALARQSDLAFSQRFRGAVVFENAAGLPIAAAVLAPGWIATSREGEGAAAGAEASPGVARGFAQGAASAFGGTLPRAPSTVLLAEDFSPDWHLRAGKRTYRARRSFGWATAFDVRSRGRARIDWGGQSHHRLALLGQLALVLAFAGWWSQRAARERGER
jgi:GT2 family glycosyltransferase